MIKASFPLSLHPLGYGYSISLRKRLAVYGRISMAYI